MSDKNSTKKNEPNRPAPKDLPAKPVDKKTDDNVKGGARPFKFDV